MTIDDRGRPSVGTPPPATAGCLMSSLTRSDREQFHRLCPQLYSITREHPMSEVLRGLAEVFQDATQQRELNGAGHVDQVLLHLRQARDAVLSFERYGDTKAAEAGQ